MTTVALISHVFDMSVMAAPLRAADPTLDLAVWPDPRCLQAEVAVCWAPPPGTYARMPKLRLVHGVAAGVDNLLQGQDLGGTPLCRVVDPGLAAGMEEFVRWGVTLYHREIDLALANQRDRRWLRPVQRPAAEFRVGVMGLGELGGRIATLLLQAGYDVAGWSRSEKALPGVRTFAGDAELAAFAARCDALVVLLPLTAATRGILDRRLFDALPDRAALIHVGRGEHLVPADLIAALASGRLRGALIDVFASEPLPPDDPLWATPGVIVTPHMASMASFVTVGRQVAENIRRLQAGEPLLNVVDVARGY
ncbi:2-hydroxyacid dehydrogenase [Pseudorhodoferax sp.]|uniref:2-hydroxyacid dehydrogenase n=1 Tax=Pseudorhodoferax sp. TaxID=1993553 RepID=UPI002DD6B4B9|nr:glyoxylate/hydroxypyruvate reductase A [Pseudorhodoferax sp.]